MEKKFSLLKFLIITALLFLVLDLIVGKYIYKNFIRGDFIDADLSTGIKHDVFDHTFKKSYKTNSAGWGPIRFTICTDPNGFRSDCKNQHRELKNFDIAFTGDSNTEPVGINYENSFVGIIDKKLEDKKIANLAMSSYSPAIHYAKINFLLSQGYIFNEVIVFIDISDIRDETVCYELKDAIVKRRNDLSCLHLSPNLKEKIFVKFRENLKLSFVVYKIIENKLITLGIVNYSIPNQVLNNPRSDWTHNYNKKYYRNLNIQQSTSIAFKNMEKLADLLKKNNIDLSVAVYPWPGTLKYDVAENKQVLLWKNFCKLHCKKFYNFMNPFFDILKENDFTSLYKKVYIKDDIHFNEEGNKIIAEYFLKLYFK